MGRIVFAAWLRRLAKHLAGLACLAIIIKSSGWAEFGQGAILALVVAASSMEMLGKSFSSRRSPGRES